MESTETEGPSRAMGGGGGARTTKNRADCSRMGRIEDDIQEQEGYLAHQPGSIEQEIERLLEEAEEEG